MRHGNTTGGSSSYIFSNRARRRFVLFLISMSAMACIPPAAPRSAERTIEIVFDTATTLPLHYGEMPVAYDRVRRVRGRIQSAAADTITLAVHELFRDDGPGGRAGRLVVASSSGAPTARIVVPAGSPQQSPRRQGNIGASIAELALVLRLGILLSGRSMGGL